MKKIIFFILTLVFFSCKKETAESTPSEIATTKSDSIVYATSDFEPHLKFDSELVEYDLTGLKDPKNFTAQELAFKVKENDYNFNKSADFKYYTTDTFDLNDVKYEIIAYSTYGENDAKVANLQLNSYVSNKQVDAVLLDCRFTFEIEYYRHFEIKKDGSIIIKKFAIDGLRYNEAGDIIGKKAVKDTVTDIAKYKINTKGQFIKY
ncbi:hypothetical protein [Flavobacterium algicola]|uniref:hypothetical protein n=1 Tax=Flavobacterium algicola TaxID=556529 RepID=UPI001EFE6007|nr:hypothetical protein [Flavobacterium algicola]MCG9791011.1 hypothetical protein [Flavobacterium algicola]